MPVVENLPDLSHWKTVQEFSITQAALLLAGIDPYDYANGLEGVRSTRHERWKMAWGISEGIISAMEGANKRGNSSRLTQSFHFFMFEPIFSPVNALNQPI